MNRSWPPNPRDAKHRQFHGNRAWNTIPVTILLMAMSLLTCFFTRVGEEGEKADLLYFRSQDTRWELRAEWDALEEELSHLNLDASDPETVARVSEANAKLEERARTIEMAMSRIHSKADALEDIRSGQVWRLFTPVFLHFGVLHIVFNLWWLWSLGALIEIRYRSARYLLLVLGAGMLSNLAQGMMGGTNFGGMSGVNYGLFGFLFLHGWLHPSPSFRLDRQTIVFMLAWLMLCFTGVFGPIANWAHSVGFLVGAGAGFTQAMLAGGAKLIKRRGEFRRAVNDCRTNALHQCATCGITEMDDRDAEFRVGDDGEEYCEKHLPQAGG